MESLKSYHVLLKELSEQAARLASASLALTELFEAERDRLEREDEVSCLKELLQNIRNQLEELRRSEKAASDAHEYIQLGQSAVELGFIAGKELASASLNKAIKLGRFLLSSGHKEPAFGKLVVLLGPSGLPQDLKAVSISKLSRDSNKTETEIIAGLRKEGCLLLNEEGFNSVIERLISGIQDGSIRSSIFRETDS